MRILVKTAIILILYCNKIFALNLELTQGVNSSLPIAINSFSGEFGEQLTTILRQDLIMSGQFKLISNADIADLKILRQLGADTAVNGQINKLINNKYAVLFNLIDVVNNGKPLLSKTIEIDQQTLRRGAHHISDLIYQHLIGEPGIFSTRLAYVVVQREAPQKARYFLEVADVDGYNPQQLLTSTEPLMSPSWSPDGKKLAYVSFEQKKSQIFVIDVANGKRNLVTSFSGINGAPGWSPDGRQLAVVLSKQGTPKIYLINLNNGYMEQLTFGGAIDTEPKFTPDGKSLLFTSNRGGSPQIYCLSLQNKTIQRLTYTGNYNASASYTPDQKNLILLHGNDGNFNIGIQDLDGNLTQLTFVQLAESPAVAPNGRVVVYATRARERGVLKMVTIDGRINLTLPFRQGDVQEPTWSAISDA